MVTRECDYDDIPMNQACVVLNNINEDNNMTLYSLSSDCVLCPFTRISLIQHLINTSIILNYAESYTWRVFNDSGIDNYRSSSVESGLICELEPSFGEYGIYELTVQGQSCEFDVIVEPSSPYITLAIILGVVLVVTVLFVIALKLWHKANRNESNNEETPGKKRVLSIDTVRGICILAMIIEINGGGYAFMLPSTWDGLKLRDIPFPLFVWVMGICIPLSMSSQLSHGNSKLTITRGILKRSILLFFFGIIINIMTPETSITNFRILGILQRLGIGYLVSALLYTFLIRTDQKNYNPVVEKISDFISLLPQWIIILFLTGCYCVLTFCLPIPGCPSGYLGPGGRHAEGKYFNCTGGAAGYIDRTVLGVNHVYTTATIMDTYGSEAHDPEGILGFLTTFFLTFLGVQTGEIFRLRKGWKDRIFRWLLMALFCTCIGCALHFTDTIPINKNLWSLSFVLVTGAIGLALLSVCFLLIDVTSIWNGAPCRIPGMNTLVIFLGHHVMMQTFPFVETTGKGHAWETIVVLGSLAVWIIIAYVLHRKRIYITA